MVLFDSEISSRIKLITLIFELRFSEMEISDTHIMRYRWYGVLFTVGVDSSIPKSVSLCFKNWYKKKWFIELKSEKKHHVYSLLLKKNLLLKTKFSLKNVSHWKKFFIQKKKSSETTNIAGKIHFFSSNYNKVEIDATF